VEQIIQPKNEIVYFTSDLSRINNILELDGFVLIITGKKDDGKTNFGLRIAEYCYLMDLKDHIATNIKTESYIVEKQITNIPDLKFWMLHCKGRKLFLLDEAAKHLSNRRALSKKSVEVLEIIQLLFHYGVSVILCCPTGTLLDSGIKDSDMWDLWIKKRSKQRAIAIDNRTRKTIKFKNIPKTSIKYNRRDIAELSLVKDVALSSLRRCCQVAKLYGDTGTYEGVRKGLNEKLDNKQIQRLMIEHCSHSASVTSDNT